jgi:cytochrome P450
MGVPDLFFDPLSSDSLQDPYGVYRRLREQRPIYWHEQLGSWVLTRYADCLLVLSDSDLFAADFRRVGIPTPPPLLSLQTLDPPEQAPLRNFALSAMQAQDLFELEEDATRRAEGMLADLSSREQFDFVSEFADPFTLGTISRLLGVEPPAQDEEWQRLNEDLDKSMESALVPEAEEPGLKAREAFNGLVSEWLTRRPEKGILGYVWRNRANVEVDDEILVNSIRAFWHAGFEVPSRFLGNAVLALLSNPIALAGVRSTDSLASALEELVRYAGPVHAVSRACTRAAWLGEQQIERGDVVISLLAAANRDPAKFDRPEELVLDRHPNPHLGFGRGAHSCLGFRIAKMQAKVVVSTMLRSSYPDIGVVSEPTPRRNATLRGLASLPLSLGVRATRSVA